MSQPAYKIDDYLNQGNPYEAVDERPVKCYCSECGEAIYSGNDFYDGDEYAETPDGDMCMGCFMNYVDEMKKTA